MELRRGGVAAAVMAAVVLSFTVLSGVASTAASATQPVAMAAPYEYLGWGDPEPPTQVMAATGVHDVTLAFILSHGSCNPEWDGARPLTGGVDASTITAIRAAGGDVDVSIGGWNGKKLGSSCKTVAALTAAYRKVVTAYALRAVDVDIEHTEFTEAKTRQRVIAALAALQQADPGLEISVTFGTDENGPDADGVAMIDQAAALGFQPYAWTIMPFDFGAPVADMGATSIEAAEGLDTDLVAAYHESAPAAYQHIGISSMNGQTDETDETVSLGDFQTMLAFSQSNHLARFTFWSVNRDRPCPAGAPASDSCSGIAQALYAFTSLVAHYQG
ncbi:MAG: chitinase [Acidimicrobiales bacterium]